MDKDIIYKRHIL